MSNDRSEGYNSGVVNKSKAREYALDLCSKLRPQYTRISPEFLVELEEVVRTLIREKIVFSKSKKRTLK
jgi:hypothetical protein